MRDWWKLAAQSRWFVRLAALTFAMVACASEDVRDKVVVQGTIAAALSTNQLEAVAIAKDGRTFWAKPDAERHFKLTLPVGQPYRIVLVRSGERHDVVVEITLRGPTGSTFWLDCNKPATIRLGEVPRTESPPAGNEMLSPEPSRPSGEPEVVPPADNGDEAMPAIGAEGP